MKKRGEIVSSARLYESTRAPPKKEANPASLRSAAPSKGRGSRGRSLLPMEGGVPKGRRLDGGSGMKESEEDRLKCVVYESTLSTAARSPFPNGEGFDTGIPLFSTQRLSQRGRQRGGGFAAEKGSQPRLAALGSPFQGKGIAWKGRRLDGGSGIKKRRNHQKSTIHESTLCKQLIKPIYSYKKRKSNAGNDFNVICRSGYRYMHEKS